MLEFGLQQSLQKFSAIYFLFAITLTRTAISNQETRLKVNVTPLLLSGDNFVLHNSCDTMFNCAPFTGIWQHQKAC